MATTKTKNAIQPEKKPKRPSIKRRYKSKTATERKKSNRAISLADKTKNRSKTLLSVLKASRMLQSHEVDPAKIPLSTIEEKEELLKILEEAEISGEINLSRFSVPMET